MKTFLKLVILFTAFAFGTANAAPTAAEVAANKTAAIKAVTDVISESVVDGITEEEEKAIKTVLNNQIALYPEFAADMVTAALKINGVNQSLQKLIVRVATFTAPNQLVTISNAIDGVQGLDANLKAELKILATNSAANGSAILAAANNGGKTIKGLVSFN